MTGNSENFENPGAARDQTPSTPVQASGESAPGPRPEPAPGTDTEPAHPPREQSGARSQEEVVPDRFQLELERLWDTYRTADGRTMGMLGPDERVMVALSRPERVTGTDREQLAGMLAGRHRAGDTLAELAGVIRRSPNYVRTLIAMTGEVNHLPAPEPATTTATTTAVGTVAVAGEMVELSRSQRARLAELIAAQHTAGVSIPDLAEVIGRSQHLVRTLILEAGGTIHPSATPRILEQVPEPAPVPVPLGFRTRDGRPYAWLPPQERTLVELSMPRENGYLAGEDRVRLAGLLADRYAAGATLAELAVLLNRTVGFVRTLIAATGTAMRPRGGYTSARADAWSAGEVAAGPDGPVPVGVPKVWTGPPEPMARVQPDDLDWGWTDRHVYVAELIVDLYAQGRTYTEVAAVTGYPADDIRAMVLAAGTARPHRVEDMYAAWRDTSRQRLALMHRPTLLLAWLDGTEVEDLAATHHIPADLLWDLIADELANTTPGALAYRTHRARHAAHTRPACAATVCVFGCHHTCAATLPDPETTEPEPGRQAGRLYDSGKASGRTWPPHARLGHHGDLGDRITLNDDGSVTWTSFNNHAHR